MHTNAYQGNGHHHEQHVPELPRDLAAERCFAGLAIMASDEIAAELDSFDLRLMFDDRHKAIVRAVQELRRSRQAVTGTSLREKLVAADGDEDWSSIIEQCSGAPISHLYAATYAGQIREAADARAAVSRWESGIGAWRQGRSYKELLAIEESRPQRQDRVEVQSLESCTTAELLAGAERPDYLIPGVLVRNELCVIGGASKSLKTSLMLDMALSMAAGRRFLRHFRTVPCRVGIISCESGRYTLATTAKRIADAAQINIHRDLPSLYWCTQSVNLSSTQGLATVEKFIADHELEFLALDPLYLMLPDAAADAANVFIFGAAIRRVAELGARTGCTPAIVHHAGKGSVRNRGFEPIELSDLSQAGAAESCRQWILAGRRERYLAGTGIHRLWLNIGGSAGHSGTWAVDVDEGQMDQDGGGRYWDTSVMSAADAQSDAGGRDHEAKEAQARQRVEADQRIIIDKLMEITGSAATKTDLRDKTGLHTRRFSPAFDELVTNGHIKPTKLTKENGHEYDAWELADDDQL